MRILLIHNFYQYLGGEDTYVTSLKKLLEDSGHEVYLYSKDSKDIKTTWDKIKAAFGLFYNPWLKKDLTKIIKKFKPDIAHFHNIYPLIGATAYEICKKNKISVIQHIANYRLICPKGIMFRNKGPCELCINKNFKYPAIVYNCYHQSKIASIAFVLADYYHRLIKTYSLIDKYIFQSKFTRDYFINSIKIPLSKTEILPHFVPETKYYLNKKKDYFIYVGRLSEEKGIIELLDIFKTLKQVKLIVVGDGPLKKQVELYNKYKNIKLMGFLDRDEILKLISRAIATIIPSKFYETGPFVLMESYSVGTPVIAPNLGIFKDEIKQNNTGFLFDKNNYKSLRDIILFILRNYNLIKYMNKSAKEEFDNNYNKKIHLSKLLSIYKELIKMK